MTPAGARQVTPIFLLSLPRSGSTFVQRVVAAHSGVSTTAEPWFLLPLLYSLRATGVYAEYGHGLAAGAVSDFCERLPGGRADYRGAIRDLAIDLYSKASDASSTHFLDKTPRYGLVVDDLVEMFPESPIVVLWRNPLATVASLSETWARGRWQPHFHKIDLFDNLERLTAAVSRQPDRFVTASYESLVTEPYVMFEELFSALGLSWEPEVVADFASVQVGGRVGDRSGMKAYSTVTVAPLDKWRTSLGTPVRRAWCHRYLSWMGRERLAIMGYDLDELRDELDAIATTWKRSVSDAARAARGVVYDLVEPHVVTRKLVSRRGWRYVHRHD